MGVLAITRSRIAELLKATLPAGLYARLEAASRQWREPIFARDPETGLFECIYTGEAEDGAEDTELIDAACLAAEILGQSGEDFAGDPALVPEELGAGSVRLEYRFAPDQEATYAAFRRRLEELSAAEAGIHAEFQKSPAGFSVNVRLDFVHDFDYHRKKDAIEWALQLARIRASGRPVRARRL